MSASPANFVPLARKVSEQVDYLVIDLTLLSVFLSNSNASIPILQQFPKVENSSEIIKYGVSSHKTANLLIW